MICVLMALGAVLLAVGTLRSITSRHPDSGAEFQVGGWASIMIAIAIWLVGDPQ